MILQIAHRGSRDGKAARAAGAALAAALLGITVASCGSVGPKPLEGAAGGSPGGDTDGSVDAPVSPDAGGTGGTAGAAGGAPGSGGAAGAASVDAAMDRTVAATDGPSDGTADAGPLPVSCQQIKQQTPSAASGVFSIAPLGAAQSVFCEMTVDGGGWTAFYVGDNGTPPGGAHFETAADSCPDPANRCIRRLPINVDQTHDFAVKCGASVVKFKMGATSIDYFRNGLQHQWQSLTSPITIDVGVVGKANLIAFLWTGDVNNDGWIVAGDNNSSATTFANGYNLNGSWNYCNGSTQPDSSSRVMLFYR